MKFVLFRHAHKGILPFDDPELSLPGFEQAGQILDLVKDTTLPVPTHLYVSPRRRTSQSLYPLSKNFAVKIEVQSDLDQHHSDEKPAEFRKRIQNFLDKISQHPQRESVIFACTHYDWIEESMTLINCDKNLNSFEFSHWSPSQFILFEIDLHSWKFIKKGAVK